MMESIEPTLHMLCLLSASTEVCQGQVISVSEKKTSLQKATNLGRNQDPVIIL